MLVRVLLLVVSLVFFSAAPADARRVALVIGQDAYPGGASATVGLPPLSNSRIDGAGLAAILVRHGFDVIACDGASPGCFDLTREKLVAALASFEAKAKGADLALVYYAGHGLASEEGNILAPVDARVSCDTGAVTDGVPVERFLQAADAASNKLIILDACRNNPIGDICPSLKGKKLTFTRIEAGAMQGLLLVTSTQFGQEALDGQLGAHSPFADALLASLEAHANVYFEQLMNEVALATYEAAQKNGGFVQIPGKVVGGAAPADCLAGKDCIGDPRMAALAAQNESLAAEASGVRTIIVAEEKARGKAYSADERKKRVAELGDTLARIASSSDPLRQEAKELIQAGNLKGGEKKLDEALDADEKAILEAERVAAQKRKAAAQNARDLAVLALGRDVRKAIEYFKRATRLDPDDTQSWQDLGNAAMNANQLDVAVDAFEQADLKGDAIDRPFDRYWALIGLGDIEQQRGNLERAAKRYESAQRLAERTSRDRPEETQWRRDIFAARTKLGDIRRTQGNAADAHKIYASVLEDSIALAKEYPNSAARQQDVSIAYQKVGDALAANGDNKQALAAYENSLAAIARAHDMRPDDAEIEMNQAIAHERVGDMRAADGKREESLASYDAAHAVWMKLAATDPGNADWQRGVSVIDERLGDYALETNDIDKALSYYQTSLDRMAPIRRADPNNAAMQRFAVITMVKVGKVLEKKNDDDGALKIYAEAIPIIERLTSADPNNSLWQRDRAILHESRGGLLQGRGDVDGARAAFNAALKTYEEILARYPADYQSRLFSVVPHAHLADLAEPAVARRHLEAALGILRSVKAEGKLDAQREGWIGDLEKSLAAVDAKAKAAPEAARPAPKATDTGSVGGAPSKQPAPAANAGTKAAGKTSAGTTGSAKGEKKPARAAGGLEKREKADKSPFYAY